MKKKSTLFLIVIAIMTIGYASKNAVMHFGVNSKLMMDIEDFKFEIKSVTLNNRDISSSIADNKQEFSFLTNIGSKPANIKYGVSNLSTEYDSEVSLECEPMNEGITISQESVLIKAQEYAENTISFSKNPTKSASQCEFEDGYVWDFDYTGDEQNFSVPCSGIYKLETWGAQGGSYDSTHIGGHGGYSSGEIELSKNNKLYINIGGEGSVGDFTTNIGGYNGGGKAEADIRFVTGSGGGATHVATISGVLESLFEKRNSIIMVAGGGGGSAFSRIGDIGTGGSGGGFVGGTGFTDADDIHYNTGGNQISSGCYYTNIDEYNNMCSGTFGKGADLDNKQGNYHGGGGGGGYYGGSATIYNFSAGGGGGSGYIGNTDLTNKAMYCYKCEESTEESTKTISTTCANSTATENCAKEGNGYARITLVESNPDIIQYTCKLNVKGVSRTDKAESCIMTPGETVEYNFTGDVQEFTAPCDGIYELTAYGAGGENGKDSPGQGSIATGRIELDHNEKLYVYVGKQANTFNGGGSECQTTNDIGTKLTSGTGCGATDFRFIKSTEADKWSGNTSLESRVVTAGGGGGTNVVAGRVWSNGVVTDNTSDFSAILYNAYTNETSESNGVLGLGSACVTGSASLDTGDAGYTASGGGGGGYYGGTTYSYNLTGTYNSVITSKNGVNPSGKSINNWLVVNSEHVIGSNVGAHAGTSLVKETYTIENKTYAITNAKITENVTTTDGKAIIKYIGNK